MPGVSLAVSIGPPEYRREIAGGRRVDSWFGNGSPGPLVPEPPAVLMMHAFLCTPGFEAPLAREIGPGAVVLCPGVVGAEMPGVALEATDFVFARQVLPGATMVEAASISRLAGGAFDAVLPALDRADDPWRLHLLLTDEPADPSVPGELARRAALVGEAFLAAGRRRRRRVHRRLVAGESAPLLVQLLLLGRDRLLSSVVRPVALPRGGLWPAPFPAGTAEVPEEPAAPSGAYRKLREALLWMRREIRAGERCVDLGAAPGGWSYVALEAGARVVAVDRADLDPDLSRRPGLVHERRTAFSFTPGAPPVDWLLCDVIAFPDRSLDLLRRWAENRWFRRAVFHLKFRGREDYSTVPRAVEALGQAGYAHARAKHLYHDKNEVTLMAMDDA